MKTADSWIPWKDLRNPEGADGPHFENHWARERRLTVAGEGDPDHTRLYMLY